MPSDREQGAGNHETSRRAFMGTALGLIAATGVDCSPSREAQRFEFGSACFDVSKDSALLWTRAFEGARVRFEYAPDPQFAVVLKTAEAIAGAASDFVHVAKVTGLRAGTRYFYRPIARTDDGDRVGETGEFVTALDGPASLRIAWSADFLASYRPFAICDAVRRQKPDVFLMLGDATYANHPTQDPARDLVGFWKKHRDVRADDHLRQLLATTATYATWDDHDCANNTDRTHPLLSQARQAFRDYWPLESADPTSRALYRSFRRGALAEFFVLDTRTYRDPDALADAPSKTMLGATQKEWLKKGLAASAAPFKFIVSSVPFLAPFERDSWFGFAAERDELKDFVHEKNIPGVIVLSGDFHLAWELRDEPSTIHEFIAGPLAAWPFERIKAPYVADVRNSGRFALTNVPNFGLVDIALEQRQATATIRFMDGNGVERFRTYFSGAGV